MATTLERLNRRGELEEEEETKESEGRVEAQEAAICLAPKLEMRCLCVRPFLGAAETPVVFLRVARAQDLLRRAPCASFVFSA